MIFLLYVAKSNLLTKINIIKSTSEFFTYESVDPWNFLHTSHLIVLLHFLRYRHLVQKQRLL